MFLATIFLADPVLDNFVLEAIKPAPSLAVLVWVVYRFLQHLDRLEDRRAATDAAWLTAMRQNTETIGRNNDLLTRVAVRLGQVDKVTG